MVIVAVPPLTFTPVPLLSKVLLVIVGAAESDLMCAIPFWLKLLFAMLGAVPVPLTDTPLVKLLVIVLWLRLTRELPVAMNTIPEVEDDSGKPPKRSTVWLIVPLAPALKKIPCHALLASSVKELKVIG